MASITGQNIIKRALRLLRALGVGQSLTADQQTDGLTALNAMVDAWLTERLTIPQVGRTTKVLTASTQDYTIGTTGDIAVDRPIWIPDASIIPAGLTSETPIRVLSDQEWAEKIPIKSQTATFPLAIYYNYGLTSAGLGTISTWPVQTTAPTLVLYTPDAVLTTFATATTAYQVPPGYERALTYNLAIELAPEWGRQVGQEIVAIAVDAKADIKRANVREELLGIDEAILARRWGGVYNWRTDGNA